MPAIKRTCADDWFSKAIRMRSDFRCERCGAEHERNSMGLHCSHYMGRGNWATRFDVNNAFAHCYGCHSFLGANPSHFRGWVREVIGEAMQDEIEAKAKQPARGLRKKVREIAKHYREEYRRLDALRMGGQSGRIELIGYE